MERRIITIDWLSRLFAIASLLGVIGIGLFLYNQQQKQPQPTDLEQLVSEKVDQALEARAPAIEQQVAQAVDKVYEQTVDQFRELNEQAKTGIGKLEEQRIQVQRDVDDLLAKWESALEDERIARDEQFRNFLADMRREVAKVPSGIELNTPESNDDLNDDAASGSGLRVARLTFKPLASSQGDEISIENTGDRVAEIFNVIFLPRETFRVENSTPDQSLLHDLKEITFTPADNRATEKGAHRDYVRVLENPIRIRPGEKVVLRLRIDANGKHLGWGFVGDLKLDYADGELEIPNARAIFVETSNNI